MKYLKFIILSLFFIFPSLNLFCENFSGFVPFISKISISEDNLAVKIEWKDIKSLSASYLIYRHTEEINRNNFSDAYIVEEVKAGKEFYYDLVTDNGDFYYAVVAKSKEGNIFNIFLPNINTTIKPIAIKNVKKQDNKPVIIKNIKAAVREDSIALDFDPSRNDRKIAVIRSINPIFSQKDIGESIIVNIISSGRKNYIDYTFPGIPYYYCIIDANLLSNPNDEITASINSTIEAVKIPLKKDIKNYKVTAAARSKPVPNYRVSIFFETGTSEVISNSILKKISLETENIISNLLIKYNTNYNSKMMPELLKDFFNYIKDSSDNALAEIIKNYFIKGSWEKAEKNLVNLKQSSEKNSFKNKCSFYLGQVYYFNGNMEKAYMEFLLSSENYYPESKRWMENILQFK